MEEKVKVAPKGWKVIEPRTDWKVDQARFNQKLLSHKKLISGLAGQIKEALTLSTDEMSTPMIRIKKQARDLALVGSGFRCNHCNSENNLTLHHLILKGCVEYMPYHQYISQRYYWANMIILCVDCHCKFHKEQNGFNIRSYDNEPECINQKLIDKLKKSFGERA